LRRTALTLIATVIAAGAEAAPLAIVAEDKTRLEFTAKDIRSVQPSFDQNGQPGVSLRLGAGAADRFAAFTRDWVGTELTVMVCERIVLRPTLQTPIEGGEIMITGIATEEVQQTTEQLMGVRDCTK
jgi:preprotein translocase subunit SecD